LSDIAGGWWPNPDTGLPWQCSICRVTAGRYNDAYRAHLVETPEVAFDPAGIGRSRDDTRDTPRARSSAVGTTDPLDDAGVPPTVPLDAEHPDAPDQPDPPDAPHQTPTTPQQPTRQAGGTMRAILNNTTPEPARKPARTGLGFCVVCWDRDGKTTVAVDEMAGSHCKIHIGQSAPTPEGHQPHGED
jgi:hypothetical protein